MEGTIGEVRMFAGTFAPQNWALCDGQLMSIAQNHALFSILGITYGGNGVDTFALPDLRSRVPVGAGQGPNLSEYDLGEATGAETVPLTAIAAGSGVASGAAAVPAPGGSNIQPVLGLNYVFCLYGVYPSRD